MYTSLIFFLAILARICSNVFKQVMHSLISERFMNKAGFTCLVTLEELFLKNLKMYEVSPRYVQYLSAYQEHLFTTSGEKASRKYIGVILEINNFKYFT